MTNKVELNKLTQVVHKEQAFLTALNENFLRLQQAINDTLSRSGVVPNQMEEVLDMNGKRIVNVGAAVEDTDALTRGFIQGLIADVEAAVARLNSLVEQAKQALEVYAAEYILPPAIAARDDAIAAKNAAQTSATNAQNSYLATRTLYDQLASLVDNLEDLLTVAHNISDISTVSANIEDINNVADALTDLQTIASNLTEILAAPTFANNAATWAEGTDAAVQDLGGTHSAKKWAELSQADVAAEAQTRQNADNNLQSQIDAITAGANVKDIVGTYQDLQNYDTTSLSNQDIVKVISDSMHNNASSYYRWVITGGSGAWVYVGSEGPYLTPSAASETYVPKTTTINSKALSGNIILDPSDVGAATAAQGSKADTALQNTATGTDSLTILGTAATGATATNIGVQSIAQVNSIAVGQNARASATATTALGRSALASKVASVAIGTSAQATAEGAIALGTLARNSETKTLKVALKDASDSSPAVDESTGLFTLLTGDGKIPNGRLTISTSMSSSSTDSEIPSLKLLYDTCGDIETLILAL